MNCRINGYSIADMCEMELTLLREVLTQITDQTVGLLVHTILEGLDRMIEIGLPYLHLNRETPSLSGGEAQRLKLVCLCSISCCGFSHDDFSGLGRACRPRNGLNWMVLVSPPERTGKDYDQHAPSTVYPSFAAERGIRRVDRAENTCQRADGA